MQHYVDRLLMRADPLCKSICWMQMPRARSLHKGDYAFLIASPEKALCDLIANSSKVNLRYLTDVEHYLEQDIRMDMEEFYKLDATVFEDYIKVGKKADSIVTLLKYLKR